MDGCWEIAQECVKKGVKDIIWGGEELDWIKPERCREFFRGVGLKYLIGEPFLKGFRKLLAEYTPGRDYELCLIVPCSYGKPYHQSYIHYLIRSAIKEYLMVGLIHEVIVTNAGVVPREIDEMWPYIAYDWNPAYETKEIKECYIKILSCRLLEYFKRNLKHYHKLAAFLRWNSDSWKAVELASKDLGIEIPNLAPNSVPKVEVRKVSLEGLYKDEDLVLVTPTSLQALKSGVKKVLVTKT